MPIIGTNFLVCFFTALTVDRIVVLVVINEFCMVLVIIDEFCCSCCRCCCCICYPGLIEGSRIITYKTKRFQYFNTHAEKEPSCFNGQRGNISRLACKLQQGNLLKTRQIIMYVPLYCRLAKLQHPSSSSISRSRIIAFIP